MSPFFSSDLFALVASLSSTMSAMSLNTLSINKAPLVGLVLLIFSSYVFSENIKSHYPTGEVELIKEYAEGKQYKKTIYDKSGNIKEVLDYDANGKQLKLTIYYDTGVIKGVGEVKDGKVSKSTVYYENGKTKRVVESTKGKISKITVYHQNGEIKSISEY